MLFNSAVFFQFFAAVLLLAWLMRGHRTACNWLIVVASYLFYGWWDWRFLGLLLFSSLLDFGLGLGLARCQKPAGRKALLATSLICNLGILGLFKYHDFFAESLAAVLNRLGVAVHYSTLGLVLPVGISFYTFQSMSYTFDVYRGTMVPTRSLVHFLAFVSFFPQLVAGPIERAAHLLPQFAQTRRITMAMLEEGVWLLIWGLFKKVVLADNLAPLVDLVYGATEYQGPAVVLGTIAFGLQIYCDFSGYSDMARGAARLLGFDIMWNFRLPYTATNLRDFWRRWHISLSTWLRDYLYISLGGNRRGPARTYLNLWLTMLLGGLWHGAAWNFVLWGAWHGLGLMVHRLLSSLGLTQAPPAHGMAARGSKLARAAAWLGTMLCVFYGWLLFRARSLDQIVCMTAALTDWTAPVWLGSYAINLVVLAMPLVLMQWWQHRTGDLLAPLRLRRWAVGLLEGLLVVAILLFWEKASVPFIYFQF
jgi:D-alanyl-lipoteichoic acid acyltransferase DltB (MBOAT superfamily)